MKSLKNPGSWKKRKKGVQVLKELKEEKSRIGRNEEHDRAKKLPCVVSLELIEGGYTLFGSLHRCSVSEAGCV